MTEPNRPHCRAPEACQAKSEKHCRGCNGAKNMAEIAADPRRVAERKHKAAVAQGTLQSRAKRRLIMKRIQRDPVIKAKMAAAGSRNGLVNLLDQEARERGCATRRRNDAVKTAERAGIPLCLVTAFRGLRRRRFPVDEIVASFRSSYPEAFAAMEAAAGATTLRDLGPIPAIGMPGRAEWTRRANAVVGARV